MSRLRSFLDRLLEADEAEVRETPLDLIDLAAALYGSKKALLFKAVGPERAEVAGNVVGSRDRLGLAFDCSKADLLAEVRRRLQEPIPPKEVDGSEAPIQEVQVIGDEVDLTRWPIHLQHEGDAAPYISAGLDVVSDERTGRVNVGCRRFMLRGRRELAIDLNPPSDLRALYQWKASRHEPLPLVVVIGTDPVDFVGAAISLGPARLTDELHLVGGLRGESVPVVRALSVDAWVPADAEVALEGYLDPSGFTDTEGPYGEYLGYDGDSKINPVFRVTAITSRAEPLFQTATIGSRNLAWTDTAHLMGIRTELLVWMALETAVRQPVAVYVTPASGGMYHARVAMDYSSPGGARNAIAAILGSAANIKHVFVVDPDVDVFSEEEMEWALATRFQADRDLVELHGLRKAPLDPSAEGAVGSKVGFDLTLPRDERTFPAVSIPPTSAQEDAPTVSVREALSDKPRRFVDLIRETSSRDGREIVRELEALRSEGAVKLGKDGLYRLVEDEG
jgi:2,5-furandicarboxylate decarboxylase 1